MEKIISALASAMDGHKLVKIVFAGKRKKSLEYRKVVMRPVTIKGEYMYQAEFFFENKVTHRNIPYFDGIDFASDLITRCFKQTNILTETDDIQILAAKPDNPRITIRSSAHRSGSLSHDRKKHYIIEEGIPCDFLIHLGVMSTDGKIYRKHYSKFRQINRFLEIADNCFDDLPGSGTLRIIDFGCGKSYLTFALYHYLHEIKKRRVEITGLDLKEYVINFCNKISQDLGYNHLKFMTGDIADYKSDGADMVVTLHACDTATDFALINAVKWNSKVILSVPCCQHELFSQIRNEINEPMLKHGIIRDKFTELLTDGLRGLKLESMGYSVNMLEFTSLEHTSKNIMIKAVKTGSPSSSAAAKAADEYLRLRDFYNVSPMIDKL